MLTNNDLKYIRSLSKKKYRQKYNNFVIEGKKMLNEALNFAKSKIEKFYCLQEFYQDFENKLKSLENKVTIVNSNELKKISNLSTPNSGLAILSKPSLVSKSDGLSDFVVYLDEIQDPGNMGTIIRTCEWFGVDQLVVSTNSVDVFNPKVLQASMGSIFRLPVFRMDFEDMLAKSDNHKYLGALLTGENLYEKKYKIPLVVVIGNESKGISDKLLQYLDYKVTIPGYGSSTESLNASVAAGIIVSELKRTLIE